MQVANVSAQQQVHTDTQTSTVAESATNLRLVCVQVMLALHSHQGSLTHQLPKAQRRVAVTEQAQLQAWCFGMCRWSDQLDALLGQLLKRPLKARDTDVLILMQLGIFQLMHTSVAEHAAVDESVKVVKRLKKNWAVALVNAVLRNFIRHRHEIVSSLSEPARFSHPDWLLKQFQLDWPEQWQSICEQNNQQGPMTLRVNRGQLAVEQYQKQLLKRGLSSQRVPGAPDALTLSEPVPVFQLPGFDNGDVSVQDAAAQLAAGKLIRLCPTGGRLLDACAAPGGKTAHVLENAHFDSVLALDKDADRLARAEQTFARLSLAGDVQLRHADASTPEHWWDGQEFSAILLDAPCSGTGVIRRHPDIKLLKRYDDIDSLVQQQRELLDSLWPCLLPGGILLYCTCSVLHAENQQQVNDFLDRSNNAELAEQISQILPGENGMDGFFYAPILKNAQ